MQKIQKNPSILGTAIKQIQNKFTNLQMCLYKTFHGKFSYGTLTPLISLTDQSELFLQLYFNSYLLLPH